MNALALFRRFPSLEAALPRVPLGTYPTPVQQAEAVGRSLDAAVWVKRDDLTSAEYGGNKVRKLEFILAQAERAGARRLLTVGAAGSHHALATAVHGARRGFAVTLVLFPQRPTPHVRGILLADVAAGAELRFTPRMESIPLAQWLARRAARERVYVIPAGGSSALGSIGYVNAALELLEQVEQGVAPRPDVVHVPAGTLGTAAGLAIGFALARAPVRIRATRITSRLVANQPALRRLVRGTLALLAGGGSPVPSLTEVLHRIDIRDDQIGAGYGRSTPAGDAATRLFARSDLHLDDTYTAKAAAGLVHSVTQGPGATHLFWQTLAATPRLPDDVQALEALLPPPFRALADAALV